MNEVRNERNELTDPPGSVYRAVKLCKIAGVTKLKPAIHHGCIRFLMAEEGVEENIGGIAYRFDDSISLPEMQKVADEVNKILSQNNAVQLQARDERS